MYCAFCNEKISGMPVKQASDFFCSLECANLASGIAPEEAEEYYEEGDLQEYFEEEE